MRVQGTFQVGDPVWAKMKGFPIWPGRIDSPEKMTGQTLKKGAFCVYFFGSRNYASIMPEDLKPYQEFKEKFGRNVKLVNLKRAVEELERFLAGEEESEDEEEQEEEEQEENDEAKKSKKVEKEISSDDHNDDIAEAEFEALLFGDSPAPAKKAEAAKTKKRPLSSAGKESKLPKKKIKIRSMATPVAKPKTPKVETAEKEKKFQASSNKKSSSAAASLFLDRPPTTERPVSPTLNVTNEPRAFVSKDIKPTEARIGFLGLGIMGSGMVKNLLDSGHHVTVWNRTPEKCRDLVQAGAAEAMTPGDVVADCDITFSCIADPQTVKDLVFGNCGVLSEMTDSKSYVEMTGIDADTSQDIAEAINLKCGRYLEAQIQGSKSEARSGTLVVLAAGDRSLYEDCQSCFQAVSKNSFFLGEVGMASKMNLVIQAMSGVVLAGLAEGVALGDRAGLKPTDILDILKLTSLDCPLVRDKVQAFIDGGFVTQQPLRHLQKDLNLTMGLSQQLELPLPMTAVANEVFKHAKKLGYGEHDTSAVYIRARF
jgi:3-hydroxyisobutyrate dehydrogenase